MSREGRNAFKHFDVKKREIIDGLSSKDFEALQDLHAVKFEALDKSLIKKIFRARASSGHKGTFGHTLIVAGSGGTSGAAILCCMSALRTGCGLVTALVPDTAIVPLLSNLPEAMTKARTSAQDLCDLDLSSYDAIGFGPGVGTGEEPTEMLRYLLENYKGPLVIDADGLTILARNEQMYALLGPNTILTPHPVEFSRISVTGSTRNDLVHAQLNFFKQHKCVILVKGKNTTVVNERGVFYNTTGNSGMATAGSGDVLTGIIASLCAQDYLAGDAALIGTFMHGFAGDVAAGKGSMHSLIASDIVHELQSFFRKFESED